MAEKQSHKTIDARFTADFYAFLAWFLTPREYRDPNERNAADYSRNHNIATRTLWGWTNTPLWESECRRYFRRYLKSRTDMVRNALFEKAAEGDVQAIKLFLQYEHDWAPKEQVEVQGKISLTDFHKARMEAEKYKAKMLPPTTPEIQIAPQEEVPKEEPTDVSTEGDTESRNI